MRRERRSILEVRLARFAMPRLVNLAVLSVDGEVRSLVERFAAGATEQRPMHLPHVVEQDGFRLESAVALLARELLVPVVPFYVPTQVRREVELAAAVGQVALEVLLLDVLAHYVLFQLVLLVVVVRAVLVRALVRPFVRVRPRVNVVALFVQELPVAVGAGERFLSRVNLPVHLECPFRLERLPALLADVTPHLAVNLLVDDQLHARAELLPAVRARKRLRSRMRTQMLVQRQFRPIHLPANFAHVRPLALLATLATVQQERLVRAEFLLATFAPQRGFHVL